MSSPAHIIVIGTGVGGLATALRLLATGAQVTIFEAAEAVGGKMRTAPSTAGPVDAGPTVLTMRWVFDDLFGACGESLDDHVTLTPDTTIARHFWSDGTTLDLMSDPATSARNVAEAFGARAAREFKAFSDRAKRLFTAFDRPMMRNAKPSSLGLAGVVMKDPRILGAMAPHRTLAQMLRSQFSDPKLRQLFGRYATYVGGSPYVAPALLSLIWHAEGTGVWSVKGGMHALARAMRDLIVARGGIIHLAAPVTNIASTDTGVCVTVDGARHHADAVVFNGDPRALTTGHLGHTARTAVSDTAVTPRSLSADVMAFAAIPQGVDLSHHNVFFGDEPRDEFDPIAAGKIPTDPTLYICAQDRGGNAIPTGPERFEIIMNAAPCGPHDTATHERAARCQTHILKRLGRMGLTFSPMPEATTLTQPADFNHLFPASLGSLYGRSPHGMTAGLKRPTARTAVRGLYLAGGGAHPGAGVPMATLSGLHAAEAICTDLRLTSPSRPTVTRGGTSTASATTAPAPSASSPS